LVLNMFNVAIGRDNIRPDLRFVDTVRDAASSVLVATLCAVFDPQAWCWHATLGIWRRRQGSS
jgi:hypothetical protein